MVVKLLILEDSEQDAQILRRLLSKCRLFEVKCEFAASVSQCELMLERISFDCILADYNLPNGQGLSVISRLRAASLETPIIVVTGSIEGLEFTETVSEQAAGILYKDGLTTRELEREIQLAILTGENNCLKYEIECLKNKPPGKWHRVIHAIPDLIARIIEMMSK